MKIYTKTGDKGNTSLFNGDRVSKTSLRIETYGTIDELNSIIGISISFCDNNSVKDDLLNICNLLFTAGTDLATPYNSNINNNIIRINQSHINLLENLIDKHTNELPELKQFILPTGNKCAAFLHQARTVCRRAERLAIQLLNEEDIGNYIIIFLNRLSDYLFTAARYSNFKDKVEDIIKH
jgi:cob(I)alamin adenosyltransferase